MKSKLTAIITAFFMFFSMSAPLGSAQQITDLSTSSDKTVPTTDGSANGNSDLAQFCGTTNCGIPDDENSSPIRAASPAPSAAAAPAPAQASTMSHSDQIALVVTSIRNLIANPKYTVDAVNDNGTEKLKITYNSSTAQTAGTLTSLSVNMNSSANNRIEFDMNSLSLSFKGQTLQAGDADMLDDSVRSLLEIGFTNTPSMDAAAAETENASDLYTVFSLASVQVSSVKTTGADPNTTRSIAFKSNGLAYTASRQGTSAVITTPVDTNVKATMSYISGLQASLGSGYKVKAESYKGTLFNVSIKPVNPVTAEKAVSQIDFSITGTTVKVLKIYTASGTTTDGTQLQTALADKAAVMLSTSALTLAGLNTSTALTLLTRMSNVVPALGTTDALSALTYALDGRSYRIRSVSAKWITEDVTYETELRAFVLTELQNKLNTNTKVEILSISATGQYEVKISSTLKTIPANEFQSFTFKIEKNNGQIQLVASTLSAIYKGIAANATASAALYASLGITEAYQSPAALEAITGLSDKLASITKMKILSAYDAKAKKITFTLNNHDYRTSFEPGVTPYVEDRTDYRAIDPYLAELKTLFPGASVNLTPYQSANGFYYNFSIVDSSTVKGELVSLGFNVTVVYDLAGKGTITPAADSLQLSFNGFQAGTPFSGSAAALIKDGFSALLGKTDFEDTLKALRSAKLENVSGSIFTVLYGGKRYDIKSENNQAVVYHVYDVKAPAFAVWKSIEAQLNPVLAASSAAAQNAVAAMKTELLKTGGNVMTETDREGSVYIRFFSNSDGTLTTLKITNDPHLNNNQKTLTVTTEQISTLSGMQAKLYLENMAKDTATAANAADIKAMLEASNASSFELQRVNNMLILRGSYNLSPATFIIYPDQTVRVYSGAKAPSTMPTIAAGITAAASAFDAMDNYFGKLPLDQLLQVEDLRSKMAAGAVKFINIEKTPEGAYSFTWFTNRNGEASNLSILPATAGSKVLGSISASTISTSPLTTGQTKSLLSSIELYLKNFTTLTAAAIKTHLDELRGSTLASSDPLSPIEVSVENGKMKFYKSSLIVMNRYTVLVDVISGAVSSYKGNPA